MKICPVGAELFHAEGRTDRHTDWHTDRRDEANGPLAALQALLKGNVHVHAMKAYNGSGGRAPFILKIGTRWRCVFSLEVLAKIVFRRFRKI